MTQTILLQDFATATPTLIYAVVPIGIGPPNFLQITLTPGNSTVPFTSVTGGAFVVTRPDGTVVTFPARVVSATNTVLVLGYLFDDDEITLSGLYDVAVQLQVGTGGLVPANPFQLLAAPANAIPPTVTPPTVVPDNNFAVITSIAIGLISAPFNLNGLVTMGQSLGAGFFSTPVINSGGMKPHVKLFDSSGSYTDPNASTLSLVDANGPLRPQGSPDQQYPTNIQGETPDLQGARNLRSLALGDGYVEFACALTNVCLGGTAYVGIAKGGTANAYAGYLFEIQAIHRLYTAANPGKTYGVFALWLVHGESDAGFPFSTARTTYAGDLRQLQSDVQADAQSNLEQASPVPMFMTQQSTYPAVSQGAGYADSLSNSTALAMSDVHDGKTFILVGPKYQYTYYIDNIHLIDTSEQLLGEKYDQATFQYLTEGSWDPLRCISVTRNGAGCVAAFDVPVAPLQWDPNAPLPHQVGAGSGYFTQWANGYGFEALDHVVVGNGAIASVANAGGLIQVNFLNAHPYNTGDVVNFVGQFFSDEASLIYFNKQWTVTKTSSTALTLQGSVFASLTGSLSASSPLTFRPLTFTATPVISGDTVSFTFDRVPARDFWLSYAQFSDVLPAANAGFNGNYMAGSGGCGGRLMDSDTYAGISGIQQPNRLCIFQINPP